MEIGGISEARRASFVDVHQITVADMRHLIPGAAQVAQEVMHALTATGLLTGANSEGRSRCRSLQRYIAATASPQ